MTYDLELTTYDSFKKHIRNILLYSAILGLLFLASCGGHGTVQQKKVVPKLKVLRLAYQLGHLNDIVAKSKHWFEEEFKNDSIEIQYKKFDFGIPEVEAFVAHKIDFGSIGDQPAVIGWSNSAGYRIVGNNQGGSNLMAILVPYDSKVTTFKQLKGKKIGITIGSNIQNYFDQVLKQSGFKQSDVNVVNLQFSDCVTALSLKEIDATLLADPYVTWAEYNKSGKVIAYSGSLKYFTLPLIASDDLIDNHPDIVVRILKVYNRANIWAKEHKEEAADILVKEENNLLPKAVDLKLIDKYTQQFGLGDSAIEAIKKTFFYLKATNVIRSNPDINNLFITTFDKEARKL
jgi:sulfonate transport system substrate-binding protein